MVCDDACVHALAADLILLVHGGFILFVVAGEICVIVGHLRHWRWVHNRIFRLCHLLAIGVVAVQAWAQRVCPLTEWENALREAAGQAPYAESFIRHWVGRLVYCDAPPWVFTLSYSLFAALVLATWFLVRPCAPSPTPRS